MRTAIAVVVVIAVTSFAYVQFIRGRSVAELRQLDDAIRSAEVDVEMGRAADRKLPQFRAEVQRLEQENDQALDRLPNRPASQAFESRLREIASRHGCRVIKSEPVGERDLIVDVDVAIAGNAAQLTEVVRDVESMQQLVGVSKVSLVVSTRSSMNFLATVYAY